MHFRGTMTHESDGRFELTSRTRRTFIRESVAVSSAVVLGGLTSGVAGAQDDDQEQTFSVRIENVSEEGTLMPSGGSEQAVPLSPGVYAIYTDGNPLFTVGEPDRGRGLEAIAEDGSPSELSASLTTVDGVVASGVFNEIEGDDDDSDDDNDDDGADDAGDDDQNGDDGPGDDDDTDDADDDGADDTDDDDGDDDDDETGPIGPGQHYEFVFEAEPDERLTFATMFVPSNDLFFAPVEGGISLFENGEPISADVTNQVELWDAGTEENEEPGVGENQVQRQSGPDTGPDEGAPVRSIGEVDDGFTYPAVEDVIRVTVTPAVTSGGQDDDEDGEDDGNSG